MKQLLVVIGNGMTGIRTVEELLAIAPDKYEITVFGSEPYGNYNRIMLSSVLSGEKNIEDIVINDRQWYVDHNIVLHACSNNWGQITGVRCILNAVPFLTIRQNPAFFI